MVRWLFFVSVTVPAVATANEGVAAKCTSLLRGVASSGHSDAEVAAFCRAAYTPEMCGTLRASLGKMPWSEAKIQDACQQWDADVMTRGLMSYDELSESLEASANTKAQLGYNMPRNSDGTVNIDQSVQMKLAQTQSMVDAYNQYMGYTTLPPPGAVGSAGAVVVAQMAQGRDLMDGRVAAKCSSLLRGV